MTMHRFVFVAVVGTLLARKPVYAGNTSALWFEPSLSWYGIDGNWSSTTLFVGEPAQEVQVTVSTSLSEVWLIDDGGCDGSLCDTARGGVYDASASSSWASMGLWQLGLKNIGIEANGNYAHETVVIYDSVNQRQTSLNKLLVAAINDTTPYTGFFGLGMTPGNFNGDVASSPIADLVEHSGIIQSRSYGYTAGAYYGNGQGVPMSLTLGGYDANRFVPHNVTFNINTTCNQPETLVRAITASVSDGSKAPESWSSPSMTLSSFNESFKAIIDSSTPYLWLPPAICDRFASAFNLKWNETFGLYLFSDTDNLESYQSLPDLSFAFTLSSSDNEDDTGSPLDTPGVINMTVSGNAFVQSLSYPFLNLIEYGAPVVPYFPLKRANGSEDIMIIGRSFLQEVYMITNYETNTFTVHQAVFPDDPKRDTWIQAIAASPNSPYPGPPPSPTQAQQGRITTNEIAGVVVGICAASIAIVTSLVLVRRKRRQFKDREDATTEYNEKTHPTEPLSPPCPSVRIIQATKNRKLDKCKQEPDDAPRGVGADLGHARYEMPATLPIELNATDNSTGAYFARPGGEARLSQDSYERPQQWADLSLVTPDERQTDSHTQNSDGLVSPIGTQFPPGGAIRELSSSPSSSPTYDRFIDEMPSPMSMSDSSTIPAESPSPIATFFPARTLSRSISSARSIPQAPLSAYGTTEVPNLARSPSAMQPTPELSFQRTPIETTEIVCLGPLPDDVRPPRPTMQRQPPPHVRNHFLSTIPSANHSRRQSTADTLGSNFTLEEEARVAANAHGDPAFGRIDGFDIVHVPQMAHRRYSWEE